MGASNSTYLGVYLTIPHYKTEIKHTRYINPDTGHKQKSKFHPDTGVEGVKKIHIENVWKSPSVFIFGDCDELEEDMFFQPAYSGGGERIEHILVNSGSIYSTYIDQQETKEIVHMDIDKLIERFKQEYKPYLDKFLITLDMLLVGLPLLVYSPVYIPLS